MNPNPSCGSHSHSPPPRSILAIDLNQIPSPSETLASPHPISPTSLVRSFHDHHPPAAGPAAVIVSPPEVSCSGCGGSPPENASDRLVCDGCERGFHLGCAGVGCVPDALLDWVCGDCSGVGVSSRRWPLGRRKDGGGGSVMLLDMNLSPPSDGDCDGGGGVGWARDFRKPPSLDDKFCGYTSGSPLSYSNIIYSANGFGINKAPALVTHTVRLGFQDFLHQRRSTARRFEDITYSSQLGRINSNTTFRLPPWNPCEVLQSLKEFVSERHGILEEGWRVEFKQSKNGCESYAVYCAPDGKMFETMSDVACYLGLASNRRNSLELETKNDDSFASRPNGAHLPKRRKLTRLSTENGFTENRDSLSGRFSNGFSSNMQNEQLSFGKPTKTFDVAEAMPEENGSSDFHQFHDGLPLQHEDFFILSLGKIDTRDSYHNESQIWPVGYRSCWHDKITGSLFLCDVLDGGDTGPVFKVRRFSCSALPIPFGSTVLHRQRLLQLDFEDKGESRDATSIDEESCVEMYFSDPCFPAESDVLSWLLTSPKEVDVEGGSPQQPEVHSHCEGSHNSVAHHPPVGENIGEFSVDGDSSSQVWNILSDKLADACHQIFKQTGSLKFFCKHAKNGMPSFYDIINEKNKDRFSSLDKYCSLLGSLKVPSDVKGDDEHLTIEALKSWMNVDRFGLDTEFVQELLEQCPEVHRCSRYESLKRRNVFPNSPLVGNGYLLINGKSLEECKQDSFLGGLYREYKTNMKPAFGVRCRPPGKHLGMNLPPHLVGDVLQAWQFLCRFHEILSLEPLNFGEFEAELIRPWFESLSQCGSSERDSSVNEAISADGSCAFSEQASSPNSEIDGHEGNRFVEMGKYDGTPDRLAFPVYSKCACIPLQRAHMSLLDVLVCELQIKVAAVVDPSIDGETKSRRGRRKDVDSSILAIKPKLNLLPMNELTWPELARRYILAVMSVDGNHDLVETGRECGKLFRCLQGDGGVLCGSLTGVAGIEADGLFLAAAMKRIYGSSSCENKILVLEDDDPELTSTSEGTEVRDGNIPAWAQALEPVKKLPTNVGTRIRKCVHEALNKDPPDWARKILEHSISKEVYKGNASGPTKKAVLSVLLDAVNECSQQKTRPERKKTIVALSEIIMKKCRIILRLSAASDEEKVFCNLLGRNLLNSSENDEEGFLGSPAMVSRSLDFRTIDLRLAVGAYGGSHEAFYEDVCELWKIIHIVHAEQPDLVQLAETLFQKFELLYEEEVVTLVQKLKEYSELEQISTETKKEIEDIVSSTSEIPKAPWDEGVCKVCGIDRDDDSVLLCDTCDAEYHTYCLNPPLARIPKGNWYCPSCVTGRSILGCTPQGFQYGQRCRRKYHGEGIHSYLEELGQLATVLEQKEFWEFSVEERVSFLKFLCDEVLNSILVRQQIEQCAEMSADLQQKLRFLYSEWKSLKLREDLLVSKAAKVGLTVPNVTAHISVEGQMDELAMSTIGTGLQPATADKVDHSICVPCNAPLQKDTMDSSHANNENGKHDVDVPEKSIPCRREVKSLDSECEVENVKVVDEDSASPKKNDHYSKLPKRRKTSSLNKSVSNPKPPETGGLDSESTYQVKMHEHCELNTKSENAQGASVSSGCANSVAAESLPCSSPCEVQTCNHDLSALQKDLSSLQQSIASAESQLLKSSVRMDFLGSDCSGRLYWVLPQSGESPWVIVDNTMVLRPRSCDTVDSNIVGEGLFLENPAFVSDNHLNSEGSSVTCPFVYRRDFSTPSRSQWVYYESDSEIKELVKSLKDSHPKERELKDSILHWLKPRLQEFRQTGNQDQMPHVTSVLAKKNHVSSRLITKASTVLERKCGSVVQPDKIGPPKKRLKQSKITSDEKMYRCQCLEPIWPSKSHCLTCHNTFFTSEELGKHSDGNCRSKSYISGKQQSSDEALVRKTDTCHITIGTATAEASNKSAGFDISKLIKFQNESACPYKFEEISSKFVTNDSIKELVHGIGFIGSEGTPSFLSSASPYPSDPALVVCAHRDDYMTGDTCKINEKAFEYGDQVTGNGNTGKMGNFFPQRILANKNADNVETRQSSRIVREGKGKSPNAISLSLHDEIDPCCTVPESSMKPLVGRGGQVLKQLKICLLEMEAVLPEGAFKVSRACYERRRAWHAFVKAAETIFEMVQATIVLEDMIKLEYLKNEWWYWSSLSAAAKISTLSSLALRFCALDNAIIYDKTEPDPNPTGNTKSSAEPTDQQPLSNLDPSENCRLTRRSSKRRKEAEG